MRWIKLIAILSLGLFFFGVLVVLHLCISVLRLPNRWKIVSRWIRGFTWSMSKNSEYQNNGGGRRAGSFNAVAMSSSAIILAISMGLFSEAFSRSFLFQNRK